MALVPLPHRVMATLEVQPHGAAPVYVDVPEGGRLVAVNVKDGEQVTKGHELARLVNEDTHLKIAELEGKQKQYEIQLDNCRRDSHNPRSQSQISQLEEALKSVENQLKKKMLDQDHLRLVAQVDGTVLLPPMTPAMDHDDPEGQLPSWSGTPLEEKNRNAYLREGVLFCQVGDPRQFEAVLIIDQGDIDFVKNDQEVDIKLDELPHDTLHGRIVEVANYNMKVIPQRLSTSAGGDLPVKKDPKTGLETPQSTSYQARVPLDDTDGLLRQGLRGRAKIHTEWMSLGARLWRLLTHTFNFKL